MNPSIYRRIVPFMALFGAVMLGPQSTWGLPHLFDWTDLNDRPNEQEQQQQQVFDKPQLEQAVITTASLEQQPAPISTSTSATTTIGGQPLVPTEKYSSYDELINHLMQLERAPEVLGRLMERVKEILKRFSDRFPHRRPPILSQNSVEGASARELRGGLDYGLVGGEKRYELGVSDEDDI